MAHQIVLAGVQPDPQIVRQLYRIYAQLRDDPELRARVATLAYRALQSGMPRNEALLRAFHALAPAAIPRFQLQPVMDWMNNHPQVIQRVLRNPLGRVQPLLMANLAGNPEAIQLIDDRRFFNGVQPLFRENIAGNFERLQRRFIDEFQPLFRANIAGNFERLQRRFIDEFQLLFRANLHLHREYRYNLASLAPPPPPPLALIDFELAPNPPDLSGLVLPYQLAVPLEERVIIARPLKELGAHIRHGKCPRWELIWRVIKVLVLAIFRFHLCDKVMLQIGHEIHFSRKGKVFKLSTKKVRETYPYLLDKAFYLKFNTQEKSAEILYPDGPKKSVNTQCVREYYINEHSVAITTKRFKNTIRDLFKSHALARA